MHLPVNLGTVVLTEFVSLTLLYCFILLFFLLVWDFFVFFLFSRNKFRATTSTAHTEGTEQGSLDDV